MTKRTGVIIGIIILIYLGVTLALQPKLKSVLRVEQTPLAPSPTQPSTNPDRIVYNCEAGKTVLELLRVKSKEVETQKFPFGELVTTIGSRKSGEEGKYWTFFVDDKLASVSADNYRCQNGEKVEWRFGKE